jgi:alpha,alpha-trehalase
MLVAMALAVLSTIEEKDRADFLGRVANAAAKEYEGFWKASRFDKEWGLFRYGNINQGALGLCPEVLYGERDEKGLSHYDKITAYLRDLPPKATLRQRFFDEATNGLSVEGMAGDRAMRESGFDASMHMGYYGLETMDHSPACLNSLLYTQCHLLGQIYKDLGQRERAQYFDREANEIAANIHRFMWNDKTKLFHNFNHRENRVADFVYLTCAYPLWAGIATPDQARSFRDHLPLFETPFGLRGTDQQTGCQWDAPFMWAPLVYFTVAGLNRYGYKEDARRIAKKFIDTVDRVNQETGANFEKYNAETGGNLTENIIDVGYSENVVGFGWTNGTVLVLQNWLQSEETIVGWVERGRLQLKQDFA